MPHAHHVTMEPSGFPVFLVVLALTGLVYFRGWLKLGAVSPGTIPGWRAGSFYLGVFMLWLAVGSPIAALHQDSLTVHMIQHLLLMTLAAPLILLGEPALALLYGVPRGLPQTIVDQLFRSRPLQHLGAILKQPVLCWLAATAALVGWHVPALFNLGMQSEWHVFQQASFFFSGLLFWWPVVQPWPGMSGGQSWSIVVYLFLATLPCDILSGFLVFSDRVVYSVYLSTPGQSALTVLADQQRAGAVMWTCVTIIYLLAGGIIATRMLSPRHYEEIRNVGV